MILERLEEVFDCLQKRHRMRSHLIKDLNLSSLSL